MQGIKQGGWIEVITGSMFSGKTEELIRRVRRAYIAKQTVQIFKPEMDIRYSRSHITSHNATQLDSVTVKSSDECAAQIKKETHVIAIDEAQFFDHGIVPLCDRLAYQGKRVIVAGLDQDYLGNPFGPMPYLMAIAEFVTKNNAICIICGGVASKTHRLVASRSQIHVGASEAYDARCRTCFVQGLTIISELREGESL